MVTNHCILISLTIDLISANVDEPPDLTSDLASFEKNMSTINVVLGEFKGVTKRIVNMCLGCKVHYCINVLCDQEEVDKISTGNIALDKLEVW